MDRDEKPLGIGLDDLLRGTPQCLRRGSSVVYARRKMTSRSHGNTRLTVEQAREIKYGTETLAVVSQKMHVSQQCASKIRLGQTWKDV